MNILSLGSGGFIGTHLTHRLLAEGHRVVGVDIYDEKLQGILDHPRLTFIQQDIREADWDLESLVKDADLVIDLIAYANPGLYVKMPLEVFRLNFVENLKIAEACLRHGITGATAWACGGFGLMLCGSFQRYTEGYRFSKLGCELVEKHDFATYKAKVYSVTVVNAGWNTGVRG